MMIRRAFSAGLLAGVLVAVGGCPGEVCSPETCIGCCSMSGTCEAGTTADRCGRAGASCEVCAGAAQCVRQRCSGGDAGTGGGAGGGAAGGCLIDGRCGQALVCNITSRLCETPDPCTSTAPQPAGCGPGLFCANDRCVEAPRPQCENFPSQAPARRYDPATNLGPVITTVRVLSFEVDDAGCPAGSTRRGLVELDAYDRLSRFAPDAGLPRLLVYRPNMVPGTVQAGDLQILPAAQGATAKVTVQSCGPAAVTSIVLGYAFEGGNGVCVTLGP